MKERELIKKAAEILCHQRRKRDASLLQRELGVGFAKAARLLDELEERGVIDYLPPSSPSPRRNDKVPYDLLQKAAIGIAYIHGSVSPARLEHDMEISYPLAARVIDSLEESNIIKKDGDKVRWTLNDASRGFGEEDIRRGSATYGDPLMDQARQLVTSTGIESAACLVKQLQIGYARAGRILDGLEDEGTISESPTWIYDGGRNVYLNIDGVLLGSNSQPARHVYEFIKHLINRHPVYWLSSRCKNDGDDPLEKLSDLFDDKTLHYLRQVKPTYWDQHKSEAIEISQPFVWFDDDVSNTDRKLLEQHDVLDSLITVDLIENPESLAGFSSTEIRE